MNESVSAEIHLELAKARRFLIVSHIRPDGDAVGSVLGLGLSLQAAGKEAQMVLSDGIPSALRYLDGVDQVAARPMGDFDLTIVLDASDLLRTGETLPRTSSHNGSSQTVMPDINIDHHVTNLGFARLNLVDTTAVATAEILAGLLPRWKLPVTQAMASALLTGILTDTLGFRTSNMTPQAMRVAASLMEAGANLPDLYRRSLGERSFEAARYWGMGLIKLHREDSLVWTTLTLSDRKAVEYPGRDDADLINILSNIKDTAVALVFIEQNHGHVKVSWRAQPWIDVSQVALYFGGGGHKAASGAELEGSLEEVQNKVLEATRALLVGSSL
jgi:phosphoesterase RecJ-like protein